jgi:Spy/CpxP family protein refolding chaperone
LTRRKPAPGEPAMLDVRTVHFEGGSMRRILFATLVASVLSTAAIAENAAPGSGPRGPGMMGDCSNTPGMMGGPGSGMHGMMGGSGSGMRGMMGGMGMGFGTPADFAAAGIDLSAEQSAKVRDIQRDLRASQWKTMEQMHELMWEDSGYYRSGKFDAAAARKRYEAMQAVRKQMFENALQSAAKVDAVLTQQQREKLAQSGR